MRFKTAIDIGQVFFIGISLLFPVFLAWLAFSSENRVFSVLFGFMAAIVLGAIIIDIARSAYIFEDEQIVFNALIGGTKFEYIQIKEVDIQTSERGLQIFMAIGRRRPHKVKAADMDGFLRELYVRRPDLNKEANK